jgi:hypothetical protein
MASAFCHSRPACRFSFGLFSKFFCNGAVPVCVNLSTGGASVLDPFVIVIPAVTAEKSSVGADHGYETC